MTNNSKMIERTNPSISEKELAGLIEKLKKVYKSAEKDRESVRVDMKVMSQTYDGER